MPYGAWLLLTVLGPGRAACLLPLRIFRVSFVLLLGVDFALRRHMFDDSCEVKV